MNTQPECGRVMVVEDDEDVRDVVCCFLQSRGYEVFPMSNGREALEYLRAVTEPDVILLDLLLPVMDGWQFRDLQRREARLASIPVVLLSATWHVAQHAELLEAADYLTKPIELDALAKTVARFCGSEGRASVAQQPMQSNGLALGVLDGRYSHSDFDSSSG